VGKDACSFSRSINAEKAETAVWEAVSAFLTDPERLRRDLEAMMEREKETRGDSELEAKAWVAKLSEVERKRDRHQEMFTTDAMTLDKLRSKLNALDETRELTRRELAAVASWKESLKAFERDKERVSESYATFAPEALEALDPEERRCGISGKLVVSNILGYRYICSFRSQCLEFEGSTYEENMAKRD
jgi:site-specific DNA recombinase